MALDKLTLLDETVVNNTATSTSNTIFTNRYITYKNKIINGNFDIWQRGTSLSSGTGLRFLADRWLNVSTGSTYTASRQSFTLGQTSVPNEPSFFHRTIVSSVAGSGNSCIFVQRVESVRTLAGKTATLSFWAKADSSKNIAVEFAQSFGSGGSPSSTLVGIGVTTFTLTSSWQKFTIITNIPSISGKTLGTNGNDHLAFIFWFDAGSSLNSRTNSLGQQSGTFDIAQVQLEEGNVATPFEIRPIGLELSLCQRYYQKSYNVNVNPSTITTAGYFLSFAHNSYTLQQGNIRFPVAMRGSSPVCTLYSSGTGVSGKVYNVVGTVDVTANCINMSNLSFEVNGGDNFGAGVYCTFHYTAESEL